MIIGGSVYIYFLKKKVSLDENSKNEISIETNLKTYKNEKYGIEFQYPEKWGEVKEQDKGNELPTLMITQQRNCFDLTPACNNRVEVMIATQKGYTLDTVRAPLQKQNVPYVNIIVSGFPAIQNDFVSGRVSRPNDEEPYGYYKGSIVNTEKSDGHFITVAFSSPLFEKKSEAEAYDASEFPIFVSKIKLINIVK